MEEFSRASAALSIKLTTTLRRRPPSARTGGRFSPRVVLREIPSSRPEKTSTASWTMVLAFVGASLAVRESDELGEFIDKGRQSGHFPFDQARTLVDELGQLEVARSFGFGGVTPLQEAGQSLRRKLNRRKRILDLVGDAPRDLLPCGGLLRAQHFREVIKHQERSRN